MNDQELNAIVHMREALQQIAREVERTDARDLYKLRLVATQALKEARIFDLEDDD